MALFTGIQLFTARGADGSAATAQGAGADASGMTTGGDPQAGHALFLSSCASCHGSNARGTEHAPSLEHAGTALIDFMLRTGRMPLPELGQPIRRSPPMLSDEEIADVVAYLAPLTDGPSIPELNTVSTDLARGRQEYLANCAACHGATGAGDAIGGGILAPNLRQSEPQDVAEAMVGGPPPMPRFSFAPDDRDALIAYVQYLRNPENPGGATVTDVGPVAEGFIAGFIGLVLLVLLVHWTARSRRAAREAPVPAEQQPYSGEEPP